MSRLHVVLTKHEKAAVDELARLSRRTISSVVRQALTHALSNESFMREVIDGLKAEPHGPTKAEVLGVPVTRTIGTDEVFFNLTLVAERLTIDRKQIVAELDEDDFEGIEGILWIADLGIQTALSIAAREGVPETMINEFEAWVTEQRMKAQA